MGETLGDTKLSPPDQLKAVKGLEKTAKKLKEGQSWYVIPAAWWENWEVHCRSGGPEPGPIDLTPILDSASGRLNSGLRENDDYVLRNSQVWRALKGWYGVAGSCKPRSLKGKVVAVPNRQNKKSELIIELFPMMFKFHVCSTASGGPAVPSSLETLRKSSTASNRSSVERVSKGYVAVSKYVLMRDLAENVAKQLGHEASECRVWLKTVTDPESDWKLVRSDDDQTINEDLPTSETWCLLFESKSSDGSWPRGNQPEEDEDIDDSDLVRPPAPSIDLSNPENGQMLDVQRKKDDQWYEARIENCAMSKSGKLELTVHYLSFDHKHNETIPLDSPRIAKHHTHVRDWRTQLKVDEEVEVHKKALGGISGSMLTKGTWQVGKVKKFDRDEKDGQFPGGQVLLRVKQGLMWNNFKEVWVPLRSELLAARYTHLARVKPSWGPSATSGKPTASGVVGLRNLGNTCFMNSMLQCIAATPPLTSYFSEGLYASDINRKNPLGAGGQLAEAYAELVKQMQSNEYSVVVPTDFKRVLGSHFSQFAGYQQQDSHELFSVLLDGLHEDLNRVRDKPATEPVEGKGRPERIVAKEAWDTFRLRNDSVVVDKMMGLMRSHLTCPTCNTEAVKFDAYSNWSVPVPSMEDKSINLVFFRLVETNSTPSHQAHHMSGPKTLTPPLRKFMPVRYTVSVPRRSTGKSIAMWLSKRTGVAITDIVIMELFNNKVFSYYFSPSVDKSIRSIKDGEYIVAYELIPALELKTWRRCSRKGIRSSRSGAPVSSATPVRFAIPELSNPVWDDLVGMYQAMAKPESIADTWWRTCCVDADVEESQRAVVSKLRSQRLPQVAKRTGYQAKVAVQLRKKVMAKNQVVSDALKDWVKYESSDGKIGKSTDAKDSDDDNFASPAVLARSPNGGSFKRGSVSAGGVIPVEMVHKYKEGYAYTKPFRAPDVVSFLPDASWNEIHQTVWRHVKWMFKPDYNAPEAWLLRFGCETGEASLSDHVTAAATSALGSIGAALTEVEPPYVLKRDVTYTTSKALPFSTEASELSNDTLVLEWSQTGVEALVSPPASVAAARVNHDVAPSSESKHLNAKKSRGKLSDDNVVLDDSPYEAADRVLNVGEITVDETAAATSEGGKGPQAIHLSHCFEKFRQREQLGQNDEWYCPKCKALVQAFKKMDLWSTPEILVVHLKRFLYERSQFRATMVHREKITDPISFPLEGLDISDYIFSPENDELSGGPKARNGMNGSKKGIYEKMNGVKSDPRYIYDLFAVSNHIGTMGGGHYTAYVLNDGTWYNMDDSRTSKVDADEVCSNKAYVLFYRRRNAS